MLTYPQINPVLITVGPVTIHWYGVMYLFAFSLAWWLGARRARREDSQLTPTQVSDMVFYSAVGAVLGGRVGYVLFYNFSVYMENPWAIFKVWEGGMAFHGGLLGVVIALLLFARLQHKSFFILADFVAPLVPLGLGLGRAGNFINAELWGKPTDLPWAMVFPTDPLARHPSQLYEMLLEGVVLFVVVWGFSAKPRPVMSVAGLFLTVYALMRFGVEFVREPDAHIGYLADGWLTMGQVLSAPMLVVGVMMLVWAYRRKK